MKIMKNELEKSKEILNKMKLNTTEKIFVFFDIEDKESDAVKNDGLIMTSSTKKNVGYAGLTRVGLLLESNRFEGFKKILNVFDDDTISNIEPKCVSFAMANLDYSATINLDQLFDLGLLGNDMSDEERKFICTKDAYILKKDSILAKFN